MDVGHLLGHAAEGLGEQREVGGADSALVVQVPQPPLGPVDEVGPCPEPEPAEAVVPAHGGGLAHHSEQMAIACVCLEERHVDGNQSVPPHAVVSQDPSGAIARAFM